LQRRQNLSYSSSFGVLKPDTISPHGIGAKVHKATDLSFLFQQIDDHMVSFLKTDDHR
jgi:hypothetical protein